MVITIELLVSAALYSALLVVAKSIGASEAAGDMARITRALSLRPAIEMRR